MAEDLIYLDHAAATPIDDVVLQAMMPYFQEKFFNPSSPYSKGIEVRREYELAKNRLAATLGVRGDELVMTAGATESINLAFSVASSGEVAVSEVDHKSVLESARSRSQSVMLVKPDEKGRVKASAVRRALSSETSFISVGLVNNELGVIQPISEIAQIVAEERARRRQSDITTPLVFHTDASQASVLLDVKPHRLGVDLLTLSASKVYGPKQVGLLWVRPGLKISPTVVGGGQESGLRGGTENVAGVVGFAVAMELASKRRASEVERLRKLRDDMERRLSEAIPEIVVSSDAKKGLASILHVSFPGVDAERLIFWLESRGVMAASGSACSANRGTRSHVLVAIGLADALIDGSLRISLGRLSDEASCQKATELIIEAVNLEKKRLAR